jgi:hypothetical protein
MPLYKFDISDMFSTLPYFFGGMEFVGGWNRSVDELSNIDYLNVSIYVNSGVVTIKPTSSRSLFYNIKAYRSLSLYSLQPNKIISVNDKVVNKTLVLSVEVDGGFIDLGIMDTLLDNLSLRVSSGVINLNLDRLNGTDSNVVMESGVLRGSLGFVSLDRSVLDIDMQSGVLSLDLDIPSGYRTGVSGYVSSGFCSIDYFGEKSSFYGSISLGDANPDLDIRVDMSSGVGNIKIF